MHSTGDIPTGHRTSHSPNNPADRPQTGCSKSTHSPFSPCTLHPSECPLITQHPLRNTHMCTEESQPLPLPHSTRQKGKETHTPPADTHNTQEPTAETHTAGVCTRRITLAGAPVKTTAAAAAMLHWTGCVAFATCQVAVVAFKTSCQLPMRAGTGPATKGADPVHPKSNQEHTPQWVRPGASRQHSTGRPQAHTPSQLSSLQHTPLESEGLACRPCSTANTHPTVCMRTAAPKRQRMPC